MKKDPLAFNYIKPTEDEIFKNPAPKKAPPKKQEPESMYANLEDIMKEQTKKKF